MNSFTFVALNRVTGQSCQLDSTLFELSNQLLNPSEFSGTDRGKVSGMAEHNGPRVSNPFVKVHFTFGGVGGEVRDDVTKLDVRHFGKKM